MAAQSVGCWFARLFRQAQGPASPYFTAADAWPEQHGRQLSCGNCSRSNPLWSLVTAVCRPCHQNTASPAAPPGSSSSSQHWNNPSCVAMPPCPAGGLCPRPLTFWFHVCMQLLAGGAPPAVAVQRRVGVKAGGVKTALRCYLEVFLGCSRATHNDVQSSNTRVSWADAWL